MAIKVNETAELLKKVTWPSWSELQSSSIVVAISTVIIALIIYLMDKKGNYISHFSPDISNSDMIKRINGYL